MRHRVIPFMLVAVLAGAALTAWQFSRKPPAPGVLEASGTIEATEVNVASTLPGRVTHLLVKEGDRVAAGQVVIRLDAAEMDTLLNQARAAVDTARARVLQAEEALRTQRRQAAASVAQAEAQVEAARVRLPQARTARDWQSQQVTQQIDQARAQVAAAERAVEAARASVAAIEANLVRAERDLARAEALLKEGAISAQQVDAAGAQVKALRAQREAAAAQEAVAARQVRLAEAALRAAEANRLQVDLREDDASVASAQIRQAEAGLRTARVGFDLVRQREQDVAAARAQLAQADAAVDRARVQHSNTILRAPMAGVVTAKHVEPGDVVPAGQRLLVVARLDQVWLRVFVPERNLANLKIGQPADVFIDAFPGSAFRGQVTEIRHQAEFTPRNVQTREERVKLVFGVKITLPNPDGVLKPGMPADARIRTGSGRRPADGG